ncbi:unnamed protein product, partial [Mesorhabditis belari]|uniref:Fatty-acid and retinol-binding protein 1 n=1 Tax=Mesorhabditis belari TaxID=2138241 RepID=A0AAF3E9K3_9BILA
MRSSVVIVGAFLFLGSALANHPLDEIPAQYRELIPEEVASVIKELTAEEKEALRGVAARYKEFNNEDEILAAVKEKSPSAHEKVVKLHNMVKDKVNSLQDDAKAFAKEVVAEIRKTHGEYAGGNKPNIEELKAKAKEFIAKFKALPEAAKEDFRAKFPILTSVIKSDKVQTLAKGFLGIEN